MISVNHWIAIPTASKHKNQLHLHKQLGLFTFPLDASKLLITKAEFGTE